MEVHAPAHTARKKWTHYFREFILLNLKWINRVNLLKHGLLAVAKKLK